MTLAAERDAAAVLAVVKEIIASIKDVEGGASAIRDDAVLFSDEPGEASTLEFDSLDALDLALALKERFDPKGDRFEAFLTGDVDPMGLATVDRIVTYVMSTSAGTGNNSAVTSDVAAEIG